LKRFLIVGLSLVFVLAMALSATAGVRNTVHDFQTGPSKAQPGFGAGAQRGMCSYCHIPHSSKGDRLWPTTGLDAKRTTGIIGVLCASCHVGTTNTSNPDSPGKDMAGQTRTNDVYNTDMINHVLIDDGIYANNTNQNYYSSSGAYIGPTQFGQANTWPYCGTQGVAGGTVQTIECSSCHNPHSEAYGQSLVTSETTRYLGYGNDFLRASFYNTATTGVAFCEYCHEEKSRAAGSGPYNTIGSGTHPVGTTASALDAWQHDIHIESGERNGLTASKIVSTVLYDMGIGTGIGSISSRITDNGIGTHLTGYSTGGVTCQSCHQVHGAPPGASNAWLRSSPVGTAGSYSNTADPAYLAASDDGDCNILAVENDANGGTVGYSYPTEGRTTGDYNDLCIDCHETTPSVGANWVSQDGDETRTTADIKVDAHPVNIAPDGLSESGFDLTVMDPNWRGKNGNWTNARWAGGNNTVGSDAFGETGRWDGDGEPATANSEIVCLTCHAIHDGEKGTPILRAASKNYCSDCHSFAIGTVSHPVGYGSAMRDDPDNATWPNGDNLPLSNYYQGSGGSSYNKTVDTSTDMACFTCHAAHDGVDGFMLRITDDNSRLCVGCHTDFVNNGTENPANYIAEFAEGPTTRLGSHYTGTVSDSTTNVGETRWAYSGEWTGTTSTPKQTSHWNGTTATGADARMQCQSCHTPHNAASGLVENNTYDGLTSPVDWNNGADPENFNANYNGAADGATRMCVTPTTALLLDSNQESKMCATCHWPAGTHVTTIYTVAAKPDPERITPTDGRRKYRDYCTRIEKIIITVLRGEQEQQYNVYDLIANDSTMDSTLTPESPCNFPPLFPGVVPTNNTAKMLCDSCHAPHAAVNGSAAFILEAGSGAAGTTLALNNQRIATRNYQELCWKCHDK